MAHKSRPRPSRSRERPTHSARGRVDHEVATGTVSLTREGSRVTLFLDGVESSCLDLDHPERLEFEYMQQMSAALEVLLPAPAPVRTMHLGAAACALPRAWDEARPGSRQIAVEVDPLLAEGVRTWFDLPRAPRLRIRVGDGRTELDRTRPASLDVLVRDAFDHGIVPAQLATLEATAAAARALRPGGLYLANAAHGGPNDARRDVAAVLDAFPQVRLIADPKVLRSGRRGNLVIVAQRPPAGEDTALDADELDAGELDADELDRALRRLPLPARLVQGRDLDRWLAGASPTTDAQIRWAPTDLPPRQVVVGP